MGPDLVLDLATSLERKMSNRNITTIPFWDPIMGRIF